MDLLFLAAETAEPTSRVLGFDIYMVQSMILQWINVAILFTALTFILYKPVLKIIKERNSRIQNNIDDASSDVKSANDMKALYEKKLVEIDTERVEIIETARKNALAQSEQIIKESKQKSQKIIADANLEISKEQEKADEAMKVQIVEIATLLSERFVNNSLDESTQRRLLKECIESSGDKI